MFVAAACLVIRKNLGAKAPAQVQDVAIAASDVSAAAASDVSAAAAVEKAL